MCEKLSRKGREIQGVHVPLASVQSRTPHVGEQASVTTTMTTSESTSIFFPSRPLSRTLTVTDDKVLRRSVEYDGEINIYFGSRTQPHKGVFMLQGTWEEIEEIIKSLGSVRLTDPCRLEGTDIYLQEKDYQNQMVLDIRKRRHGKDANYHILHHTHQGVTLQMSTIRRNLI
ncbi:unnamed protein product [Darwinula stevensoni]|uniref:Uncharacterized protein n=1 Tax=Darwinula stevensoni TaxID=69355 RepID=A0A7R9A704_9CRUS|nr:unnamed protein product [Darwinula stevensoni]CAG0889621.1 unnamed protein product [Darwinula stevensoni]